MLTGLRTWITVREYKIIWKYHYWPSMLKSNNNEQEAIFTCKTGNGIKLETGDTVEIMNAFISEDGCGGANMEFDGEFIFTDNGYDEEGKGKEQNTILPNLLGTYFHSVLLPNGPCFTRTFYNWRWRNNRFSIQQSTFMK